MPFILKLAEQCLCYIAHIDGFQQLEELTLFHVSRELFFDCEIKNKNPMLRHILNTMMSIA
jgi:hypothetical protein